jgi:hypothetical protein
MNRRHFLSHLAGYSALAVPACEFARTIKANAQQLRRHNKSAIILWMGGGPASIHIWDLKPGKQTGGPFKEINTSASGVKISAHMPKTAEVMNTWPSCAQAYGTTDEEGMSVKDNPVRVMDMFATVYQGLGIDPGT